MSLKRFCLAAKRRYPFLYGNDEFSNWNVMDHVLFTNGNGMEYVNGHFVEDCLPGYVKRYADDWKKEWASALEYKQMLARTRPDLYSAGMHWYPLCEYALIHDIDERIPKDDLIYICEFLEFVLSTDDSWFHEPKDRKVVMQYYQKFTNILKGLP